MRKCTAQRPARRCSERRKKVPKKKWQTKLGAISSQCFARSNFLGWLANLTVFVSCQHCHSIQWQTVRLQAWHVNTLQYVDAIRRQQTQWVIEEMPKFWLIYQTSVKRKDCSKFGKSKDEVLRSYMTHRPAPGRGQWNPSRWSTSGKSTFFLEKLGSTFNSKICP